MARIRSIKPEFFQHESIFDLEKRTGLPVRLAYIGLWTQADKRGLFRWRPRELKLNILPWDDADFGAILDALASGGFVVRYEVDGSVYGMIPSFGKHQMFNHKEQAAKNIPDRPTQVQPEANPGSPSGGMDMEGIGKGKEGIGKGKEGKGTGGGEPEARARLGVLGTRSPAPESDAEANPGVTLRGGKARIHPKCGGVDCLEPMCCDNGFENAKRVANA